MKKPTIKNNFVFYNALSDELFEIDLLLQSRSESHWYHDNGALKRFVFKIDEKLEMDNVFLIGMIDE